MPNLQKIKDESFLKRDPASKAVINTDSAGLSAYIRQKRIAEAKTEQIEKQQKELDILKIELSEIKRMILGMSN